MKFGVAQNQSNGVDNMLKKGEIFLEEYEFNKALAVCDEALKKLQASESESSTKLAEVYYLYGRIYEKGLYFDKAILNYTTALSFDSSNAQIYKSRGYVIRHIGYIEQEIGKINQGNDDIYKADNLIETGKDTNTKKLTTITGSLMKPSRDTYTQFFIAETFQPINYNGLSEDIKVINFRDLENGEKVSEKKVIKANTSNLLKLNKLVKFNPKSDLALWERGDFLLELCVITNQSFFSISAERDFVNAFDINPRYEYLVNLGVIRANRNNKTNYELAIKHFTNALKLNDPCITNYLNRNCIRVLYNRGLSYLKLKENEKAIADFTKAIQLDDSKLVMLLAYKSRAKAFRAVGKITEAEADEASLKNRGGK